MWFLATHHSLYFVFFLCCNFHFNLYLKILVNMEKTVKLITKGTYKASEAKYTKISMSNILYFLLAPVKCFKSYIIVFQALNKNVKGINWKTRCFMGICRKTTQQLYLVKTFILRKLQISELYFLQLSLDLLCSLINPFS